jgi:hypothetical protein
MKFDKLINIILEGTDGTGIARSANQLMDKDQKFKNPNERIKWQRDTVQPFIKKNIERILADKENDGDYPHAPYACWVLVQHMDADPKYQEYFCKELEKAIPNFPKLKFLQDRIIVNREILSLWNKQTDKDANGQSLTNPTSDLRDSNRFPPLQGAKPPRSAKEAYDQILQANNNPLFVKALQAAYKKGVTTQPSFNL